TLSMAYLYVKQQTFESKQRSMSNTAAISNLFLSSVAHQYQCRFSTLGGTWGEKFTKSFLLDLKNENDLETWRELKQRVNDGTIEREFYKLWIYVGASPVIEMRINDEDKFVVVTISTERQPPISTFYGSM
ncbi:MAG: hypothetical protein LUE13_00555, partial [Akkermansiaceae bacterium]|nr:hypothetical protein [Akkermansiaceae bacterium]